MHQATQLLVLVCTILFLCSNTVAQLHGSLRPHGMHMQSPADRISFVSLDSEQDITNTNNAFLSVEEKGVPSSSATGGAAYGSSGATGGPADIDNTPSATGMAMPDAREDSTPNSAAAQELKSAIDEVDGSIDYVKKMIEDQMQVLNNQHSKMVDATVAETQETEEARQKREEEQKKEAEERKKEIALELHEKEQRQHADRCLAMIRGGADKLYFRLKKLFALSPVDSLCQVFKAFEFPNLSKHGFHEDFYRGPKPDDSGEDTLFFKAAKSEVFECMCDITSSSVSAQALKSSVNEMDKDNEGYVNAATGVQRNKEETA